MTKQKLKIVIDIFMLAVFPFLMAVQITGQAVHEYIGAAALLLFVLHNIMNMKWYKTIFKGRYNLVRLLNLGVNVLLLADILCLAYSGIAMSSYVFPFFKSGNIAAARLIHLSASYWGLVLMSVHIGFHWNVIMGKLYKRLREKNIIMQIIRLLAIIISAYGIYCFYKNGIVSYLFLKNQFVFFDYEQNRISAFAEIVAMIGLWSVIGYYITKAAKHIKNNSL